MRNGMVVARMVCRVALLVALAVGTGGCGLKQARERALKTSSASNLKMIGYACHLWSADNNEVFPTSLDVLIDDGVLIDALILECPAKRGERGYDLVSGLKASYPIDLVLAYEKAGCFKGGRNVLFVAGNVQWMMEADFQTALKKTEEHIAKEAQAAAAAE
jgi:hypothetical protein